MFSSKFCRLNGGCTPTTFRQALACAVQHHAELGTVEIARRAEVPYRHLLDYCTVSNRNIPAEALIRVIKVTGRIDLLEWLVRDLGLRVVPAANGTPADASILAEIADVTSTHGELTASIRDALRDGKLDEHEKALALSKLHGQQRELTQVESLLGGVR